MEPETSLAPTPITPSPESITISRSPSPTLDTTTTGSPLLLIGMLPESSSASMASRKRARLDEEVLPAGSSTDQAESGSSSREVRSSENEPQRVAVERDDTYYMEDGSCILQVEYTLFNVHKSMLSKDGSLFSSMFQLPQGGQVADGTSDQQPLVLPGDTVREFKNFLWALYALPNELMAATHGPTADISRLVDIARMAMKYNFKSVETWALDVINDHVNRKDSGLISFAKAFPTASSRIALVPKAIFEDNSAKISQLMRLAQLCEHSGLLETMVSLLKRLMSISIQYAHLAMTLADELDIRGLRGVAYLEIMQNATVVVRGANGDADAGEESGGLVDRDGKLIVSREQQLRLLTGYYRLTTAWENLRAAPLHFDHAPSCAATWHQHGCTQSWLEFWKEKTKGDNILQRGLADYLGRLKVISKEFDRWGSATYMHHDCKMTARKAIQDKIKDVEESLPEFFSEESSM
ncbi:hypothetical protein K474DRAFT_1656325 [Panus rudis PR-1116 ss-1]|nr:hypothetical protein K474DRAFT_1656325 [Panus rudis PR-1116 ss-1]